MLIVATVVYCLQLNPTMCRLLEIAPVDHPIASISECVRGGAIYAATTFQLEYAEWFVKGWRCQERHDEVAQWLSDHRR